MNAYMRAVEQEADDFAQWMDGLSDAERGALAIEYLDTVNTVTGHVTGWVGSLSLGHFATVTFCGHERFVAWLQEKKWPDARAKLNREAQQARLDSEAA